MDSNSDWPDSGIAPASPEIANSQIAPEHSVTPAENPPWGGWDVLRICLLTFAPPYVLLPIVGLIVQKLFYRGVPWLTVAQKPWIALSTQFGWYVVMAIYMVMFVEGKFHQRFGNAIRWNWPRRYWPALIPLGMVLVSLQSLERFFHLPKHVPMEEFLNTPFAAALTAIFAVSLGPLMEELIFRGFLYPVLARRFGVVSAVLLTATAFGLVHAAQLAFAWGLVLIIFLVGLVLTIVRAKTGSVASSFLVHVSYNSTLVVLGAFAMRHGVK